MKKLLNNELIRYMLVGAAGVTLDALIFYFLTNVYGFSYYPAFFVAFPCGVLVNFLLCNKYVFSRRALSFWRSVIRHYSASIGGFVMQFSLFFCLMSWIQFPYPLVARLIAATCTFLLNFLIIKRFVFGHK